MITTMFPDSKVTKIYCMADNFCNEFALQKEKYEDSRQKNGEGNTVFFDYLHQESIGMNLYWNQFC